MAMFTAEELEELKRFDEEIDREDLTHEDYMLEELVEDILFPEKAAARKKLADYRKKKREAVPAEERKRKAKEAYAKKDKEAEKARKRASRGITGSAPANRRQQPEIRRTGPKGSVR